MQRGSCPKGRRCGPCARAGLCARPVDASSLPALSSRFTSWELVALEGDRQVGLEDGQDVPGPDHAPWQRKLTMSPSASSNERAPLL